MPTDIKIPSVGESITSGIIAEWTKADGDAVASGDVLLTLETDKVSTELTAEESGRLEVIVPAGEEVTIGAVVGRIHEGEGEGEGKGAGGGGEREAADEAEPDAEAAGAPEAARGGRETGDGPAAPEPIGRAVEPASGDVSESPPLKVLREDEAVPSRAGATTEGGSPTTSSSTPAEIGPAPGAGAGAGDSGGGGVPARSGRTTRKRMSPLRQKIASHLVDAQRTAAILTTFNECDMSAVMALRKEVQESFVARHGVKLGFMSFFTKAVVQALKDVPQVNARVDGDEIVTNHFFDIGVAIGTERGLIVPVVRDADEKSFADLEREIAGFAEKARANKITIEDLQGGVFTISNGGVYGSLLSTPILNPPQSGILGMHTIQQRPVAVGGEVVIRPMMYLALSYDHRIVDGKEAVTFLVRVKECIERPERLLVGA